MLKINDKVKVVRQGLMSTGWTGVVVGVDGARVEVQFPEWHKNLKFNGRGGSLQKVGKVEEKKKVEKELLPIPQGALVITENLDGTYCFNTKESLEQILGGAELINNNKFQINNRVYVGFVDINDTIAFNKPKNVLEEQPYWTHDMTGLTKYQGTTPEGWVDCTDGYFYNTDWINQNKTTIRKFRDKDYTAPKNQLKDVSDFIKTVEPFTKKQQEMHTEHGLCFGVFSKNTKNKSGYDYMERIDAVCHYAMKSFFNSEAGRREEIFCAVQYITDKHKHTRDAHKEQVLAYLEWVITDSPWSRYIIDTTLEQALERGVFVRTDIPANAMMCTFYALRYPTEYITKIEEWYEYVNDMGCDPTGAFFLAETGGGTHDGSGHHMLLDTHRMDLPSLERFIRNEVGQVLDNKYDKIGYRNYQKVSAHHGATNLQGGTAVEEITKMFKPKVVETPHPVLGTTKETIPALKQIIEWMNGVKENA